MYNLHANNLSSVAVPLNWAGSTTSTPTTFAYPGGKARLAKTFVSFMPSGGGIYAEPFCGRANVYFRAAGTLQFSRWRLNDLRTAPFLHAIITHGNTIEVPEHTRQEFERQKAACENGDPIALLLEPYLSYSGAGYAASYRSANGSPLRHHYQNTLRRAHRILIETQAMITRLDWKQAVADLGDGDFACVDPPYAGAKVLRNHGRSIRGHEYGAAECRCRVLKRRRSSPIARGSGPESTRTTHAS